MGYNKIRGSQLQTGIIKNEHIAPTTKFPEANLDIDWGAHGNEILGKKLVVDFVQVEDITVAASGTSQNLTTEISGAPATVSTEKGPIVEAGKNKVIIRDSVTGEPIVSDIGNEVFGRLKHDGLAYTVDFYSNDALGAEGIYTFLAETVIDFQFPQRFDLLSVSENFAANEKFVDGKSDISSRFDLTQLALDIFGADYTLDHDGVANETDTIVTKIKNATSGTVNAEVNASGVIDEVVAARNGELDLKTGIESLIKRSFAVDHQILTGDPLIGTATYTFTDTFVPGDKSLQVFINGSLQMVGVHYNESVGGDSITITTPEVFAENDIIQLRWSK